MTQTRLPEPLTECPTCGGEIDDRLLPDRLLCADREDWLRVVGDLDDRLDSHDVADIIEHARPHPDECYCDACLLARERAPSYI